MKKTLAILLTLALLLGALSACATTTAEPEETEAPTGETAEETAAPEDGEAAEETDEFSEAVLTAFANAFAKHDPKDIVCTVDGQNVDWQLYYYLLTDELLTVIYYLGDLPSDYTMALTEDMTLEQYLNDTVVAKAKYYALANAKAEELGVGLSEEAEQEVEEYIANLTEQYGGEEALAAAMAESNLTIDLFRYILRSNESLSALMQTIYGEAGEKMSDEDIIAWANDEGYIHVKHILYYSANEDGTEMDEEAKAELKAKAEAALAELQTLSGDPEAVAARFDELMNAESGDAAGLIMFPGGYTFTENAPMYESFVKAAFALSEYELSDIVESKSGYHLILRLPLGAEDITLDQDANSGNYMTLRQTAANDLFAATLARWMEEAEVTWSEGFAEPDLNALFDIVVPAEE